MASGGSEPGSDRGPTDICRFLGRVGLDLAISDRFPDYRIGRSQKAVGRCRFSIMVRPVGSVQLEPNIREISVGYESQSGPTGIYYVDVTHGAVTGKWYIS